ncbi:MAG: hypothetical protein HQL31_12410 [Planctomycetes bacterium]|nr:hypothetical protein [Planctomycetota bacterium]
MAKKLKWLKHSDLAIKKTAKIGCEEYLDHMTFAANRRPLLDEIFGPIIGLKEEWEEQGASPEELDFSAFSYRNAAFGSLPLPTGAFGAEPPTLIEESDEHILSVDHLGRTLKLLKGAASIPLPQNYPVKSMDDWRKFKHFYEFKEERLAANYKEAARHLKSVDAVISVSIPGGFDEPRQLLGEEELCLAYYEQPELVHDVLSTHGDTAFKVLEPASREVSIDRLFVHEDMAGKSGPLAGPVQIREFIAPYYRKIWDLLKERGTRIFDQDSDGDMRPVIGAFIEAGINCMHPMEPAAGMDIVEVRKQYGTKLAFYGGIDKHIMRRSKEEITAELEYKIPPLVKSGGCVFALDHRIPGGTSLENYRFYLSKVWEIMRREAGE